MILDDVDGMAEPNELSRGSKAKCPFSLQQAFISSEWSNTIQKNEYRYHLLGGIL